MKPPPLSKVPESGTAQTPIQAAASSKHPRSSARCRMRLAISRWDISARIRQRIRQEIQIPSPSSGNFGTTVAATLKRHKVTTDRTFGNQPAITLISYSGDEGKQVTGN